MDPERGAGSKLEGGGSGRLGCWESEVGDAFPTAVVRCFAEVDSTMTAAKQVVEETTAGCRTLQNWTPDGLLSFEPLVVVMAERQSSGRGRRGTRWQSPLGGFWATLVHLAATPWEGVAGLPLAVGVAVQRALRELGARTILKWPNDLLTEDGGKLGGILVEATAQPGHLPEFVQSLTRILVGIGVNLHTYGDDDATHPEALRAPHDSRGEGTQYPQLSELLGGTIITPPRFGALLASHYREVLARFFEHGLDAVRDEWLANSFPEGTVLRARVESSESGYVEGRFRGLDRDGALLLEVDGTIARFVAGAIEASRAA